MLLGPESTSAGADPSSTPYPGLTSLGGGSPGAGSEATGGSSSGIGASPSGAEYPTSVQPAFRPEIPAGTELGRYRIGERLGEGAVGVVHAAEDTHLGREIAVKAVSAFGEVQARAWIRDLAREFEAADALRHDNLLRVWTPEIVEWANASWVLLPMERADESLADWLCSSMHGLGR